MVVREFLRRAEVDKSCPIVNDPAHLPETYDCQEHAYAGSCGYLEVRRDGVDHDSSPAYLR